MKECFDSLENLNYKNKEIIFVDNGSYDKSVEFTKKKYPYVNIIRYQKNLGYSKANNIGVSKAKGKYVVLLNVDTVVDKNWLLELVKVAEKSKKIGIVGGIIYYYDDKNIVDFAGAYSNRYGETYHIGMMIDDSKLFKREMKSFYICGASLLFRRELFEKFRLFDPIYFAYYEDVDFCWRAWISGYDVIYTPKSIIYHKISFVIKEFSRKRYLTERNRLRTLLKNYELKSLVKILPGYYIKRFHKIWELKGRKDKLSQQLFLEYIKAILWNFVHLLTLIRNRIRVQTNRKRDDKFLFNLMKELQEYVKKT